MRRLLAAASAVALAVTIAAAAPESRPTSADLVRLRAASDLALSPDGARVAFVRTGASFDSTARPAEGDTKAGWSRDRQLCVVDVATRVTTQLTQGEAGAAGPCWTPDGRAIAFVRKGALWLLPLTGGEARKIATGDLEPSSPAYSPDGRTIAFLAEAPLAEDEKRARWARGGATRWEHEFAAKRLWVVPAGGGEPRAVSGERHVLEFRWSPDGDRLAYVSSATADPYEASNLMSVSVTDAAGTAPARTLDRPASTFESLAWSPDGRRLAMLGLNDGLSNLNALLVWDVAAGTARDLAPNPDRTFGALAWSGDSKSVVAVVRAGTTTMFERFPLAGPPAPLPFAGRVVTSELVADPAGRRLVFLSATARAPEDVTVLDLASGKTSVLTELNPEVASWPLGETRVVSWKNAEGQTIEGVFVQAPGAKPGAPAPLIVLPHGGPDDVTSTRFSALVQYFCSRGYSVLRPNYRGSFGYGFAFYAANRDRFGEVEQADVESGVDQLIRDGLADPKRLYFGGWSWGGYIATWIATHVHRYRAIVAGAAVSDVTHSYSLSDINHGVAAQWEYRGDPWNQPEHFDRVNPIRHVTQVKTPVLLLHGDADARVPFAESVQFYRALRDLGREVEFWAYPREDHGFTEGAHRVDYVKRWADWYDAH